MSNVVSINTPTVRDLKQEIMGKAINDETKLTLFKLLDLTLAIDNEDTETGEII